MNKPTAVSINYSKFTSIISDAVPGREVDYLLYEINNRIGFIRLNQIDNRYVQRMINDIEAIIETLEFFLKMSELDD